MCNSSAPKVESKPKEQVRILLSPDQLDDLLITPSVGRQRRNGGGGPGYSSTPMPGVGTPSAGLQIPR